MRWWGVAALRGGGASHRRSPTPPRFLAQSEPYEPDTFVSEPESEPDFAGVVAVVVVEVVVGGG